MSAPLSLFGDALIDVGRRGTIQERFERFHAANPQVYRAIVILSRQSIAVGATRLSMNQIFETLRASYQIARTSNDSYKINNDFRAPFARLLVETLPEMRPYFEIRHRKAA